MKLKVVILLLILLSCLSNLFSETRYNEIPVSKLSNYDILLFNNDYTDYVNLTGGNETVFNIDGSDIDSLYTFDIYGYGNIGVEVSNNGTVYKTYSYDLSNDGVISVDLSALPVSIYNNLLVKIKNNRTNSLCKIYECRLTGIYNNILSDYTTYISVENRIEIDINNIAAYEEYEAIVSFDGEEIEGNLTYNNNGKFENSVYVIQGKIDKKEIYYPFILVDSYSKCAFTYRGTGTLKDVKLRKRVKDNNVEICYVADISRNVKRYNSNELLDNDIGSDIQGEWGNKKERIIEVLFSQALYKGELEYYYIEGLSREILFEAIFEDGKYSLLSKMDDTKVVFDGNEDIYLDAKRHLGSSGYKVFSFNGVTRKLSGIRIYLKGSGEQTAGGISELKIYGLGDTKKYKVFSGYGKCYIDKDSSKEIFISDKNDIKRVSLSGISKSKYEDVIGRYGFRWNIYDIEDIYKIESEDIKTWIPLSKRNGNKTKLTLNEYYTYTTNEIEIKGKTNYGISKILINRESVSGVADGGYGEFKKILNYSTEGYYYIESEVLGDYNKRKNIEKIYIDKSNPDIVITYPETNYVSNSVTKIKGYLKDLTPYRVTVNDTECVVIGRYFELDNLSLVEGTPNELRIKAYDKAGHTAEKIINVIVDKAAPVLNILSPINNLATNKESIDIVINVLDMSKVKLKVRGKEVLCNESGNWTLKDVPIYEGKDVLKIVAIDEADNRSECYLTLDVDRGKPEIALDKDVIWTNKSIFKCEVKVVDLNDVVLYYGENNNPDNVADFKSKVKLEDGKYEQTFVAAINMSTGNSKVITLLAVDSVENSSTRVVTVRKDSIAPLLSIISPLDGDWTANDKTDVSGSFVEENIDRILVNGNIAVINDNSFYYGGLGLVIEGANEIKIEAYDLAGNRTEVKITIYRDTTPPANPSVHALCEGDNINVYWDDNRGDNGVSYYLVRRLPQFDGAEKIKKVDSNSYLDTTINYDKSLYYNYYIQGVDRVGNKSEWKGASNGKKVGFAPDNSGMLLFDGMKLEWLGDELDYGTDISVHGVEAVEIKDVGTYYSPIYNFGPEHTYFNKPLEISYDIGININDSEKIGWFYYNPNNGKWERIPSWYDSETGKMKGLITHFSAYAVKEDRTREFEDSDLSALKSSREENNIFVKESDGSVTIVEKETTLKGPGEYEFTLTRSINSNELAQISRRKGNFLYEYIDLSIFQNFSNIICSTESLLYKEKMHIAGWQLNIPRIIGDKVIFENGDILSLGELE
ncbi:MAG TPA: hypothetical protein PK771_04240, partial [Spirochaetota bacterium]|nr:hypothetical protein [Spirochaetota bacterium]